MMDSLTKNPFLFWFALSVALGALVWTFMRKELRTKAILYGSFLLACFVSMWPLNEKIKLGLDLRGGMHLIMKVVTDDALRATVSDGVSLASSELSRAGMPGAKVMATDTEAFTVEGIEPARSKDARTTLRDFFRSTEWNLSETATGFAIKMTDPYKRVLKEQTVQESIRTLERRVNVLGVAEPVITAHGSAGDQILVPAPRRHRRGPRQGHDQADRPTLAQARGERGGHPGNASAPRTDRAPSHDGDRERRRE